MYDVFRVRNDTEYLTAWSTNFSSFPNLLIKNASARDSRRYHCGLNYKETRYISEKYVLTLKGNTILVPDFKSRFALIFCHQLTVFYKTRSSFIKNQGHHFDI